MNESYWVCFCIRRTLRMNEIWLGWNQMNRGRKSQVASWHWTVLFKGVACFHYLNRKSNQWSASKKALLKLDLPGNDSWALVVIKSNYSNHLMLMLSFYFDVSTIDLFPERGNIEYYLSCEFKLNIDTATAKTAEICIKNESKHCISYSQRILKVELHFRMKIRHNL